MQIHIDTIPVPPRAVLAVIALLGFTFTAVAIARVERASTSPIVLAPVAQTLMVQFEDREDGAVVAIRESDGAVQAVIAPTTGGFVRGVLRSLVRSRTQLGLGHEAGGFALNRLVDGHITLSDPATGQVIDLGAFGPTNQAAFAAIMSPELAQ